jgi:transcriptional regulator with XRE-family HTH domain
MDKKDAIPSINVDYFEDLTSDNVGQEPESASENVGLRVAQLRREKGLSLEQLAAMTGFEVDFLDQIEKNAIHPQLGTIMRLSRALDQALSRMISGQGDKPYEVTRRGDRKPVARSTSSKGSQKVYQYLSLAHEVNGRHMEPLVVELEEVLDAEKSSHDGEEFIFVLAGTALVTVGEDSFDLGPGDSVYYLSSTPHSITGKGGKSTILAVLYE